MSIMNIRELREERGLTQKALAAAMGVVPSAVTNWEAEIALPQARDLPRLAETLGCSISDLFVPALAAPDTGPIHAPHDTPEEE